ncbi:type II toxin-antitoxin system RelE/ParE family toxin [Methylomonas sp. ZR1]|uniref:type II toxin-antitoxin system RelE/ParE family toxin n=1 Tax=Methylomonas sp. ZR1 TaxID=1797072 RepID=UPI0014926901|nr:type II toxin-antitoxin system RelE/ParE family toxin [Methylomonas sp. ZR1]NOV31330.1 type II toxin-antitoxin system RelE/ParE family toxin [Methylomonas sp. ZR1]
MKYAFHPEAADEYAETVAYYKSLRTELGMRFDKAIKSVIASACELPARYRLELPPTIHKGRVQGFPYNVIFREVEDGIQILAVAHHRRRPLYWLGRV